MSYELYGVLSGAVSLITGEKVRPAYGGEDESFLNKVVAPIYDEIYAVGHPYFSAIRLSTALEVIMMAVFFFVMKEALKNKNGVSDHSTWRNYDDLNEFFWSDTTFYWV